jgi:hypothetical protein
MEILLFVTFGYLIIVWKWNPYLAAVDFHNKALRLNHLVAFLFVLFCQIINRFEVSSIFSLISVYVSLVFLGIVIVAGFLRIIVERRFRNRLESSPEFCNASKKEPVQDEMAGMSKVEKMMLKNKYSFSNQINMPYKPAQLGYAASA